MADAASSPGRACASRRCSNPTRKPWPGRYGWIASGIDMAILSVAQFEFATQRRVITLVPADPTDPRNRGRKLRVCESRTPQWYQDMFYRRPQAARHSIRQYVASAFAGMLATGYIRPRAMDTELLETLYGFFDARAFGYPSWGGGLRLARHLRADRCRRLRRKRDRR